MRELWLAVGILRIELADDRLICLLQGFYSFIDLLDVIRLESLFDSSDILFDRLLVNV